MNRSVLLVDDHKILREGLRALLDEAGDFSVVGEAGSGREAIQLAKTLAPDVVVMDVAMAEMNGIEACRQLQALRPGSRYSRYRCTPTAVMSNRCWRPAPAATC